MTLDVSLRFALTGLTAAQRGLDVVSRNIGNADTPGYTRKTLNQYHEIVNGVSSGVRTGELRREMDRALQAQVIGRESEAGRHGVVERFLQQIDALQGKPDAEMSLGSQVGQMQDSFVTLLDAPDSGPLQNDVLERADTLARSLNQQSRAVTTLRNQAQAEIHDLMGTLNENLRKIDELNKSLSTTTLLGGSAPDLEDQRDIALREVAKIVDITYFRNGTGAVSINMANGQPLLDGSFREVSTEPTRVSPLSYYEQGNPASPIPPILLGGTDDITPYLKGGTLGGLIELRDDILPRMQAELDAFAVTTARRFEDAGLTLFTDSTGTVPAGYVAPPAALDYVGFSAEIRVSAAVVADPTRLRDGDAGQPGGTDYAGYRDQIQAVVDDVFGAPASAALNFATADLGPGPRTVSSRLPAGASLADFATEMITANGVLSAETTLKLDTAEVLRNQFEQHLADKTGVNIDQEIGLLIQLQRSYSSSARIISTNREMFNDLLNAVR